MDPRPAPDARARTWEDLRRPTPQWYRDAPLGFFVHWGPYSVPAWAEDHGELGAEDDWRAWFTHNSYAEWYYNTIRIPGSPAAERHRSLYGSLDYEAFLDMWDPSAFDPASWAGLFKRAGGHYAVLTTKHHDGVTLWDAPGTGSRNTVRRGPRRDLVAAFADAVRGAGLRVGLYYSGGLDWHYRPHPPILSEEDCKDVCRPKDADYARYCYEHARDLIDRYRPDVLWNDIDWPDEGKDFGEHGLGRLLEHFYATRPEGVTNDRYGGVHADFLTSEYQHMGEAEDGAVWENCRGVGLSFGYNRAEGPGQYLSAAAALRHLIDVVSRGGRLLLNVGPRADGSPWTVGVRDPGDPSRILRVIEATEGHVATSGLYERGEHIVGAPSREGRAESGRVPRSATVWGPDDGMADALATALLVDGRAGADWLRRVMDSDLGIGRNRSRWGAWVVEEGGAWRLGETDSLVQAAGPRPHGA